MTQASFVDAGNRFF